MSKLGFVKTVISVSECKLKYRILIVPEIRVTKIKTDKQEATNSEIQTKKTRKMPIFNCSCGIEILIIPDIHEMNKVIKNHLIEHKRTTGQQLKEEIITQTILKTITDHQY